MTFNMTPQTLHSGFKPGLYRTNPIRSPVITSHKSQMLIELSKKTWFFVTKKTWFFLGNNGAKVALLNFD